MHPISVALTAILMALAPCAYGSAGLFIKVEFGKGGKPEYHINDKLTKVAQLESSFAGFVKARGEGDRVAVLFDRRIPIADIAKVTALLSKFGLSDVVTYIFNENRSAVWRIRLDGSDGMFEYDSFVKNPFDPASNVARP